MFNTVKVTKAKQSWFDLGHEKRLTVVAGKLVPILCLEALPHDRFKGRTNVLVRLAPLLAPIFDVLLVYIHYFFSPNRHVWADWEKFITGGRLGNGIDPVTAPVPPYLRINYMLVGDSYNEGSLADYLGVPIFKDLPGYSPTDYPTARLDVMPFLHYQWIYQNYYRDRNITTDTREDLFPLPSGNAQSYFETNLFEQLKFRNWAKDYFVSALPFAQRGEEVLLPIEASGIVSYGIPSITGATSLLNGGDITIGGAFMGSNSIDGDASAGGNTQIVEIDNIDEVLIDSSGVSIQDFRAAYALQVWFELNAIAGSRYTESIQAHFGVRPQDSRLQRPEYLGGGRVPIKINEVVSTAWAYNDDSVPVPQANMAGHGVVYGDTNSFSYFCHEHGFIFGILSITTRASYHQGLSKMWRRRSFLDYPWPTFAKLGEQQVDKAELFAGTDQLEPIPGTDEIQLFGYQSRYADWKSVPSTNHGAFHSTMLYWTLTRHFTTAPEIGLDFNTMQAVDTERIFAVPEPGDNFWLYLFNDIKVKRSLPYYGTPNTLGFS